MNGYDVLKHMRAQKVWSPVLMLTAKDGEYDQTDAFELGADDYVTKPFSTPVLLARLQALARRGAPERPVALTVGGLSLDPTTRRVTREGREIQLTAREYALLHHLMRKAGQVQSKSEILENVWDSDYPGADNVVEVYIGYLRRKIDAPFDEQVARDGARDGLPAQPDRGSRGSLTAKRHQPSGLSCATTVPPCARTISATMARPSPVPPVSRVRESSSRTNRPKMRSRSSGATGGPSLSTTSTASAPSCRRMTRTALSRCRSAFSSRLRTTRPSRCGVPDHAGGLHGDRDRHPARAHRGGLREHDVVEVDVDEVEAQCALVGRGEREQVVDEDREPVDLGRGPARR